MKTLVLDSYALLAYFEKEKGWDKIAEVLQQASEGKCQLFLSVVNWGEVYYITLREYNEEYAEKVRHALENMPVEIVETSRKATLYAARHKAAGGLSYADCFVIGLAETIKGAEILTGDREFKRVEKTVKIQWM